MSDIKDGGPAFQEWEINNGVVKVSSQMTLRDYFAAKALDGILTIPRSENQYINHAACAMLAYQLADAMLSERAK